MVECVCLNGVTSVTTDGVVDAHGGLGSPLEPLEDICTIAEEGEQDKLINYARET